MKKFILFLAIVALFCQSLFAQTGGINFQGVARNASGAVLDNQKINLKFSILKTTETGAVEYTETKEATTNAQGIFAVVVGEVNATSFAAVDWKSTPKFLKVEMDAAGGTSFITMGTTRLQNVPYAYYANGVNANNIDGAVPVSKGGTGATDAATARTNLGLVIGTNVQSPLTAGTDYLTPTGNAATATKLASAKKINGVDFDGSSDISIPTTADASTLSGTVSIAKGGTGAATAADARANLGLVIGTNVQAPLTAGTDYLTPIGNAATATKLVAPRKINGVDFDGSANITISADASTLSGTVTVAKGGTGTSTLTGLILGNGTNPMSGLTGKVKGETIVYDNSTNNWKLTGEKKLALGRNAGLTSQGIESIAVGSEAGYISQGTFSLAIGAGAGNLNQSAEAVALGYIAGKDHQGAGSIAIGTKAGNDYQGGVSIALGNLAGYSMQGNGSIAIGDEAGMFEQGGDAIAIGNKAGSDLQSINSIIINASGSVLNSPNPGLYVKPIRSNNSSNGSLIQYNSSTSEIYSSNALTSATISDKVIVGSLSETASSAVLEANSTTKGFLPPRMTFAQRNIITNPAQGLIVYCTNCGTNGEVQVYNGTAWTNISGGAVQGVTISVLTGTITSITSTSAVSGGTFSNTEGINVISQGVCWSTTSGSASVNGNHTTDSANSGTFTSSISGLLPGVTYYIRAYATNNTGTSYGPELMFTTLSSNIVTSVSSITYNSAISGGTITTDSGNLISERGVVWNTVPNPTLQAMFGRTSNGVGSGTFTSSLTGLQTGVTYYVRSYYSTSEGTFYGTETNFTTLGFPKGTPFQGGKIAYIFQPGDNGYVEGEFHGLIASVSDLISVNWWVNINSNYFGNTRTGLGYGLENTNNIIAADGGSSLPFAAKAARNYTDGTYHDWYLPSKDELYILYLNKNLIGGFNSTYYWSSSTKDGLAIWDINITNGSLYYIGSNNIETVRPIRSF